MVLNLHASYILTELTRVAGEVRGGEGMNNTGEEVERGSLISSGGWIPTCAVSTSKHVEVFLDE
jgi:hypothetical protein